MDWNIPDFHKNHLDHVFNYAQRHETDRMYILFMLRPDSSGRVLFVDGPENVEMLRTALLNNPRKTHHCDGGGLGFSKTDSVWYTLAEDTAADTK